MSIATIVVGVDGSPASHAALRLAIDEATLRGCRVKIVACWSAWTPHLALRPNRSNGDTYEIAMAVAYEAVEAIAANPHERSMIVTECGEGEPGPTLVDVSRDAVFLVIGSTSRGALERHLDKTTVDHCLRHCDVPVIVVPFTPAGLEDIDVDIEAQRAMANSSAEARG